MDDVSVLYKQCSRKNKCVNPLGSLLPATSEFFNNRKRSKDGLNYQCKACVHEYHQRPERKEKDRIRSQQPEIKARFRAYRQSPRGQEVLKRYNASDKCKKRQKEYYARPEQLEKRRKHRSLKETKQKQREYNQRPEVKARVKEYSKSPKGKIAITLSHHRRKNNERNLPWNFTTEDWQFALNYFHGCCAVCGRQLNDLLGTHTAAPDHWIALSDPKCPGTIPTNIVPLCHGINGCNNSKWMKPADQWLTDRFGKRRAKQVMDKIKAFFKVVRSTGDT